MTHIFETTRVVVIRENKSCKPTRIEVVGGWKASNMKELIYAFILSTYKFSVNDYKFNYEELEAEFLEIFEVIDTGMDCGDNLDELDCVSILNEMDQIKTDQEREHLLT